MLDFSRTRVRASVERPVAEGHVVSQEGQGLVYDVALDGVKVATGVGTEKFDGVVMAEVLVSDTLPVVQTLDASQVVVDGAVVAEIELGFAPISGTMVVFDATGTKVADAAMVSGKPTTLDGSKLAANVGAVKAPYKLVARKQATVAEIRGLQGDIPNGGAATLVIGTVGVILQGDVYTTVYNTADDWANATTIKVGAGGVFTTSGTGAVVPNARVISLPGVDSVYLGISY